MKTIPYCRAQVRVHQVRPRALKTPITIIILSALALLLSCSSDSTPNNIDGGTTPSIDAKPVGGPDASMVGGPDAPATGTYFVSWLYEGTPVIANVLSAQHNPAPYESVNINATDGTTTIDLLVASNPPLPLVVGTTYTCESNPHLAITYGPTQVIVVSCSIQFGSLGPPNATGIFSAQFTLNAGGGTVHITNGAFNVQVATQLP